MKDVSEQAEASEPLLSRKLYDTLRKTSSDNIDRSLEVTSELLRRNFLPQAQEMEACSATKPSLCVWRSSSSTN